LSGKFQLSAVKPETAPHAMLRFVIDTKGGPDGALLCTATGGASGSVKCFKVPAPVLEGAQTLSLGGTSDNGAQPVFVANAGDDASIYMPDGKKVASGLLLGAHTRETGTASLLVRSDKTAKLIVISATAAPQDLGSIDPRVTHATHAGLGYDQVVWFGGKPGETHLYARKLKSTGFDVTPAVDLGESSAAPNVDNKESVIDFCKTGEATIARGRAGQVDVLAVLAGGRWSIPMKGGPAGGALTCRALDGVTTHIEHKLEDEKNWATVTYTKCNPGGCTATKLPLREILGATPELVPADTKAIAVADVGGKLALVWSAGAAGGIRLRFAAPDRMKETSDVVIYDGHEEGAIAGLSSFVDMKLLPLEEDALLLLSTTSGVRALRIDKAGAVTSMPMSL
jgi:hypothetical protein